MSSLRPAALDRGHERLDKIVVLLAANPLVLPADINRFPEQSLIVGAHVEQHRQAMFRRNARQRRVERHFADGNAHAARALVAEAENALSVAHHNAAHMGKDLLDAVFVGITEKEAARLAPDLREALAALAHRGRVHNGHQLLDVMCDERIKQGFGGVLQFAHEGVLGKGRGQAVEGPFAALALVFKGSNVRRQQSVEREQVAFRLGERGALVQSRMH